eukprot:scaffold22596_cov65-Cyclotella_meneghiniana.AAC.10
MKHAIIVSVQTKLLRIILAAIIAVTIIPIYYYEIQNGVGVTSHAPQASIRRVKENVPPPRLVLHVGLPKTATSAIQCRLSDMEKRNV